MNYGDRYRQSRAEAVECVTSLTKAFELAGGSTPTAESLSEMTMMDFITTIAAQNHIRFVYEKPKNDVPLPLPPLFPVMPTPETKVEVETKFRIKSAGIALPAGQTEFDTYEEAEKRMSYFCNWADCYIQKIHRKKKS